MNDHDRLRGQGASIDRRGETATPEERYARRIVARIAEHTEATTPPDVTERLRFARMKALERARAAQRATAAAAVPRRAPARERGLALAGGGGGSSPGEPSAWWVRLVTALPVAALVAGLWLIQQQHVEQQIAAAAEIDAELLSDALPPSAYDDPGFLEYLKAPQN